MGQKTADPTSGSGGPPERPHRESGGTERPETATVVVVGDRHRGQQIARRLAPVATVRQVDARAITTDVPVAHVVGGSPDGDTSADAVAAALSDGAIAIVATDDDGRNLLVTQRLRTSFGAERIHVLLNDPRNRVAFELPGVSVLCLAELLADGFATAEHGAPDSVAGDATPDA